MSRYAIVLKFTAQGIAHIGDTTRRAAAFRSEAKSMGVAVVAQYWTTGSFDGLLILESSDESNVTALVLRLGLLGFVATQTLRAYDEAEMEAILARLPQ